jgi:predicted DsbA family dithiol-disulfide isomerase
MKIEIWSDVVCPFCYIGKRRFEIALSQMPFKDKVKVVWRSYQLDPQMKHVPGQDIHDMLADKKGQSREWAKEMNNYVSNMAKEVGLHYQMDKVIPANTLAAHRLSHLALKYSLQDKMEEKLFSAYFTAGKNMEDIETLVELGKEIGLDPLEVRQVLNSEEYKKEVYNEQYFAQNIGIQGVPFFLMNEKYGVSGAQPVELFIKALNQSFQEWEGDTNSKVESNHDDANSCSTEEGCAL